MRELTPRSAKRQQPAAESSPAANPRVPPDVALFSRLQRHAGNQAVQQLVARHVIQRAVGLEFQVVKTNLWRGTKALPPRNAQPQPNPQAPNAQQPTPSTRTLLPYGEEVFREPGDYKVESDDGEMEFVTGAFPEDAQGLKELEGAASKAAEFAKVVPKLTEPVNSVHDVASAYGGGQEVNQGQSSPWVGHFNAPDRHPDADSMLAKPQVTFGLTLDKLLDFAKKMQAGTMPWGASTQSVWSDMLDREQSGVMEWGQAFVKRYGEVSSVNLQNTLGASEPVKNFVTLVTTYISEAGAVASRVPKMKGALKSVTRRQRRLRVVEHKLAAGNLSPEATKALTDRKQDLEVQIQDEEYYRDLRRLKRMAYRAANFKEPLEYPKAAHPMMARTNFKGMLATMDPNDPPVAQQLLSASIAGLGRQPGERLYPGGYYKDTLDKSGWGQLTPTSLGAIVQGPTIAEWVASIFTGVPNVQPDPNAPTTTGMQGKTAPNLPETPVGRGMGALKGGDKVPTTGTQPNQNAVLKDAPVFEYRLFEGPLEPEKWPALAAQFAALVQAHNNPGNAPLAPNDRDAATPPGGKLPAHPLI